VAIRFLITGGAGGIGYDSPNNSRHFGNTILITAAISKMDRAKAAFPKIHTFRSDVRIRKRFATLYEEVHQTVSRAQHFDQQRGIHALRSMFTTKLEASKTSTREIEINLSGPIRW